MAKKCMIAREKLRVKESERQWEKREELRKVVSSLNHDEQERWEASVKLQKLPRNGSYIRRRKICRCCGRPRGGCFKRFYLCRICLRELMASGNLTGVVKSSW